MKICYQEKNFYDSTLAVIATANEIIDEYQAQGYDLTLRQLYYQMVARDFIPNQQREYDRLGRIVSDARLAGLISWSAIVDRTRGLRTIDTWSNPAEIIQGARHSYQIDLWEDQPCRVEVWIEKDALRGVIRRTCDRLKIPDFSCRGYSSQSEMHKAALRLEHHDRHGQMPVIIHLGDHDPSGIDMTRDIIDRIELFNSWTVGSEFEVIRAALNWEQIEAYSPPPNFAKTTDSRAKGYIETFGDQSWELDALDPATLDSIITEIVEGLIDQELYDSKREQQEAERETLKWIEQNFKRIEKMASANGAGG